MKFNKSNFKILAIETSCDETAAAVIEKSGPNVCILSNIVASQIKIHKKYGGVFPEYASRAHTEKIIPVVEEALSSIEPKECLERNGGRASASRLARAPESERHSEALKNIDLIAVTVGPGLVGSLLVGVNFAKTYAFVEKLPIIGINHLFGHLYSNWVHKPLPEFPAIILIVSGGHTGLYLMKSHTEIQTLGETLDDAAGEAFDKVAKMLDLPYPGGPAISKAAAECHSERSEESPANAGSRTSREILHCFQDDNFQFPRSMLNRKDYNFSFSGLKTAVLYKVREIESQLITRRQPQITINRYQSLIAYEFQQAVIDILIGKTIQAAYEFKPKSICLCGGVAANQELRQQLKLAVEKLPSKTSYHIPPMELATDNAVMIGLAAAYHLDQSTTWDKIHAEANLKL